MKVLFYQTARGRMPVVEELDSLRKKLRRMPINSSQRIEAKLWEIKMNLPGTGGYRVFYFMRRSRRKLRSTLLIRR